MALENSGKSLQRMRALPPFHSYPLLKTETLVEADESRGVYPVRRFTFAYPDGIPFGIRPSMQHIKVMRPGIHKARSYTPTSTASSEGSFELTVKIYPNGVCSEWLDSLSVGSRVTMIGPLPLPIKKKVYDGGADDSLVVVIALGVGITHGIANVREEIEKPERRVVLVYSVRYKTEILFEDEIEKMRSRNNNFDVKYMATGEHVPGWHHGRITAEVLKEYVGSQAKDKIRFDVTGTKGMIKQVWTMLSELGYNYKTHALIKKPLQK